MKTNNKLLFNLKFASMFSISNSNGFYLKKNVISNFANKF